jgi:putative ABC transport system permease protein
MFGRDLAPMSYIAGIVLTFLFSVIVNGLSFFSLRRIDMIESLKSVE